MRAFRRNLVFFEIVRTTAIGFPPVVADRATPAMDDGGLDERYSHGSVRSSLPKFGTDLAKEIVEIVLLTVIGTNDREVDSCLVWVVHPIFKDGLEPAERCFRERGFLHASFIPEDGKL